MNAQPDIATNLAAAPAVLILDTDPGVRWSLEKGLARSGYKVSTAASMRDAIAILQEKHIDAILVELLPDRGLDFETISSLGLSATPPQIICASVDATPHTVMECMRRGASDFLPKPFSLGDLRGAIGRAVERAKARAAVRPEVVVQEPESALIGVSAAIKDLRQTIQQAAQTNLNCLIRGQSGVGKDVVAREIHRLSKRSEHPFIKVNCTALPENLLESELFGYEKGAFTGADTSKPGRFSLANKGIIFLDEIGDMHPFVQAKILQVIEHKEFTKLGGGQPVHVDVQIIAATNADLEEKIKSNAFREDLYFRLNEVYIWVPPLAKRREDIPYLIEHFMQKHGDFGGKGIDITQQDLDRLCAYDWPGNVRELESTIKRWLAMGKKTFLGSQQQPGEEQQAAAQPVRQRAYTPGELLHALEENQWNRRKTADALGMSYSALRRAIDKHKLDKQRAL